MQVTVDRVQQTGCFVVSYRPATQWRSASARSSPRAPGPACVGHDVVNLPSPPPRVAPVRCYWKWFIHPGPKQCIRRTGVERRGRR